MGQKFIMLSATSLVSDFLRLSFSCHICGIKCVIFFQVESFILEQDDDDGPLDNTSKFLLAKAAAESDFSPDTQKRLEALLEASNQLLENSQFESCSASTSYSGSLTF